ncbi:glutamate decarboxylase gad1 [Savitreella phatthalungensis]
MSLHKHVDAAEVLKKARGGSRVDQVRAQGQTTLGTPYSGRYEAYTDIPKYQIPKQGIPANATYQTIHDELDFDGRPNLNLASFVHTWMEPEAEKLYMENVYKNLSDSDEYPAMVDIHARCVSMLADLWGAKDSKAIGTATTGSSEAIMLGGLAMKRRWQERQKAAGKDYSKPNVIMGSNAQVAIEKFARYFECENRLIPVCAESRHCLDVEKIKENLDENTIGVFVILGSTYTGHYEDVLAVSDLLDAYQKETGLDIPIHVDGASGAMVAPFVHPSVKWDFTLPRVKSINTSGHKFGLAAVGLGWIIFRDAEQLPKDLIFELHYLGGTEESYTLNFSRPAAPMLCQYYNFLRLGFEGYKAIAEADLENARVFSSALEGSGYFECVSDVHRKKGEHLFNVESLHSGDELVAGEDVNAEDFNAGLPVVAFKLTDAFHKDYPHVQQASVSTMMRVKGWIIPNYPLPENEEKVEILRVVVRESCSTSMVDRLIEDLISTVETLQNADAVDMNALAGRKFQPESHEQKHARRGKKAGTKAHKEHMSKHKHGYARPC